MPYLQVPEAAMNFAHLYIMKHECIRDEIYHKMQIY